jgi:hypothetical protein
VSNYRQTAYQWKFSLQNYSGPTPYLVDAVDASYTEIVDGATFDFNVDSQIAASSAENRFKIVFTAKTLSTDNFELSGVSLYPNPGKSGVYQGFVLTNISLLSEVKVYNILGQEIPTEIISEGNSTKVIPKTILKSGMYLVKIANEGKVGTIKWIIE